MSKATFRPDDRPDIVYNTKDEASSVQKKIVKELNEEKEKLEAAGGLEEYVKSRKVKVKLWEFVAVAVGAFILGAIIF